MGNREIESIFRTLDNLSTTLSCDAYNSFYGSQENMEEADRRITQEGFESDNDVIGEIGARFLEFAKKVEARFDAGQDADPLESEYNEMVEWARTKSHTTDGCYVYPPDFTTFIAVDIYDDDHKSYSYYTSFCW